MRPSSETAAAVIRSTEPLSVTSNGSTTARPPAALIFCGDLERSRLVDVGDRDRRALARERGRTRAAHAGRAAGDDGGLAVEPSSHALLLARCRA